MPSVADAKDKEAKGEERKLFSDISAVQVVATALASVTSMLLASYIGIAGSIIGVAVASVVSTMAASLYKKFLADSAEKIKELPEVVRSVAHHSHDGQSSASASPESTRPGDNAEKAHADDEPAQPEAQRTHPALTHKKRLIIICIVSALIAVAATAAIIYVASSGEGLGAKPASIIEMHPEATAPAGESASEGSSDGTSPSDQQSANTEGNEQASNAQNASNTQTSNASDGKTDQTNTQPENTDASPSTNTSDANASPPAANTSDEDAPAS